MASRNSPVAGDSSQQSANPMAVPRRRDPMGDDSNFNSVQGSVESGHTASSSLSFYHTARVQAASNMAASRAVPGSGRNTSIDSIVSSVSGASGAPSGTSTVSHSHHSSVDTTIANAPDAASFIEANAGPLNAVDKLLKERQQQVARSEQLWRLLEKQRQMVHGMHADLEKALKDKERYRRRLKDVEEELDRAVATLPPLPPSATNKVTPSRPSLDGLAASPRASLGTSSSSAGLSNPPRSLNDSALTSLGPSSAPIRLDESFRRGGAPGSPVAPPLRKDSLPGSPLTPQPAQSKPALASPTEKLRKPAPAPLNLSQPSPRKILSDSDSEDHVPSSELERGRKRTRADDDRHREALAIAEEMRSRSNKSKSKKASAQADEEEAAAIALPMSPPVRSFPSDFVENNEPVLGSAELADGLIAGIGLPSSPRANLDLQHQMPATASSASIASVLDGASPHHSSLSMPISTSTVSLPPKSPGLPMSPRPMDRPQHAPQPRMPAQTIASAGPLSPRGLPLSPRAPRHPIPAPSSAPNILTAMSPHQRNMTLSSGPEGTSMAERLRANQSSIHLPDGEAPTSNLVSNTPMLPNQIHRGYMSDDYPELLLAPNALPLVKIKVFSSRLLPRHSSTVAPSRQSNDEEAFMLGIHARSNMRQLWRVEKTPATLSSLDTQLKRSMNLSASVPERGLFAGHAPARLDQRKVALNAYFDTIFDSPMSERAALVVCSYFSHDVLEPRNDTFVHPNLPGTPVSPTAGAPKSGWLSKKGKQFGGWKSRWFVLEDGVLRHYAAPTGDLLGSIRLDNAQVAQKIAGMDDDDEYRHFFCIVEQKRKDSTSTNRHVFCAESDDERDEWIEAVSGHISVGKLMSSPPASPRSVTGRHKNSSNAPPSSFGGRRNRNGDSVDSTTPPGLMAINYEDTLPAHAPTMGAMGTPSIVSTVPSPLPDDSSSFGNSLISGPRDAQPIPSSSLSAWGNKSSSPSRAKDAKDGKKRSMFGFMSRNNDDSSSQRSGRNLSPRPQSSAPVTIAEASAPRGPVFKVPLAKALEVARAETEFGPIPAVFFRCIQYLEYHNAAREEGILRQSGSKEKIGNLQARFDNEGDVDLCNAGEYIDIHIVASLFKQFIREIPGMLLTTELYPKFTQVCDVEDPNQRLLTINYLVHQLPNVHRAVLAALFGYLVKVNDLVDVNRMSIKNVSIVVAPSFNIPYPLVPLFIEEYSTCFTVAPLNPALAASIVSQFRDDAPPAPDGMDPMARQMASASVPPPPPVAALMQAPRTRINGSFNEANSSRDLGEIRRDLRGENGSTDIRSLISRPMPAMAPVASAASRSPSRGSPSPASRAHLPAAPMRATPPLNEDGLYSSRNGSTHFLPQSSTSSSPSSYNAPSGRPWDNPPAEASGPPTSRRAKRESTMAGLSGSLGRMPPTGSARDTSEPRKKSSYSRLKENMGIGSSSRDA